MQISVAPATHDDVPDLLDLYLEGVPEQTARKPIWELTDGLNEPFDMSLAEAVDAEGSWVRIGSIDGVAVGYLWATQEEMLDQADGEKIARIRLIYTSPDARGVGVADAMLEDLMAELRSLGFRYFDAQVGPGQRLTKNFFESHGFAARSIIMHHADDRADD